MSLRSEDLLPTAHTGVSDFKRPAKFDSTGNAGYLFRRGASNCGSHLREER